MERSTSDLVKDVHSSNQSAEKSPFDDVPAFLGESSGDFYVDQFRRIGQKAGFVITFNWAAAIIGPFWWSSRRLWGWALIFWVIELNLLGRLSHALLGDLGAEHAERAARLTARSAKRAQEAANMAEVDQESASRIAQSAENLAKVANEAADQAAAAAGQATQLVLISLALLVAIRGVQLVVANGILEGKYEKWRARRSSDALIRFPNIVIGGGLIAITYLIAVVSGTIAGAPAWMLSFPTDSNWRNEASAVIDTMFDWFTLRGGFIFDPITYAINGLVSFLEDFLIDTPWPVVAVLIVVLAWRTAGLRIAIFTAAALVYLGLFGFWEKSLTTIALLGTAAFISITIGIPIGILCGRNDRAYAAIRPILDFMQTMPAFVYLIPVIALFGIGKPPAVIATLFFGMPPVIRLTALGLKSVPYEVREAAIAFGATELTVLLKVDIPIAMPSILAGVNQTILMSLGMVVIASLIGAKGLGQEVLQALQFAATGYGILSGLAILFCAIILDRIVQGRIISND
jgi:glycine betaine/proline transport system permease protein